MQYLEQLAQLEARANRLGLGYTVLAFKAGVYPSQVSRWRSGKCNPKIATFERAMRKMADYLDQVERERQAS